jgi:preprotein translocase subunit SecD
MLDFPRWKVWLVLATIAVGIILAIPSMLPASLRAGLPAAYRGITINLGLDLAGGSHLLLEADTADVAKQRLGVMEEAIRTGMRRNDPKIEISDISTAEGKVSFMVRNIGLLDRAVELARNETQPVGVTGQRDWNVAVIDSSRIVMTPTQAGLADRVDKAMETARDVIERRVNATGTREPTIQRTGANRIVVDVPGVEDPEGLKQLLGKTARLEFKLVDVTASAEQLGLGNAPPGSQILPYPDARSEGRSQLPYIYYPADPKEDPKIAVYRRVMVSGDQLIAANQEFNPQDNSPVVSIRFNGQGGRSFARTTQENVNRPFAMILDGSVISAPNINEPILGGQAQISGNFTVESANQLAISLRSGKLPVTFKVVEESTVSPELGKDSINKGVLAGILATLVLIAYMIMTYFRFGVYTTLALLVNGLLVLGAMAVFNATLTLPGIAGFVLTIGAAVDANVLINERIREEVRRGRNTIQAVEFGYKEASTAIFDANITNVISAIILFWFGSGPIKGFAVVLAIGIATSVFTGVTFTRLLVSQYLQRNRPKELVL